MDLLGQVLNRLPGTNMRLCSTLLLAGLGLLGAARDVHAQANADAACVAAYNDVVHDVPALGDSLAADDGCQTAAVFIQAYWDENRLFGPDRSFLGATLVAPEDVQTTRGQTTAVPGETLPAVEPIETAAGSVAAVGSDAGAGAVTALAVNPSIFWVDPDDEQDVARWSRLADLTLLVPTSDTDGDGNGVVDYLGVRAGVSLTGLQQGSQLYQAVVAAYDALSANAADEIRAILALLQSAPQLEACMRALVDAGTQGTTDTARIAGQCGASDASSLGAAGGPLAGRLREAIEQARIEADSKYLGLDLRADFGDLALGGVDTTAGTSLYAGLGLGRRFGSGANGSRGVRAYVGARYFDPEGAAKSLFTVNGGLGFEAIRFYNYQRLTLVAGVAFQVRPGGSDADSSVVGDQNYLHLQAALNVPVASTASITVNLGLPVDKGNLGPVLSIKVNWRLLWSDAF